MNVWLDFGPEDFAADPPVHPFKDRLDELAAATGIIPFSDTEREMLRTRIDAEIKPIYTAFDITFSSIEPPGDHETIVFYKEDGPCQGGNVLGNATTDLLNKNRNQSAYVCTSHFEEMLDEFSGSTQREEQIDQLVTALTGTGAHELGHLFGLHHYDPYGDPSLPLADPGDDPGDLPTDDATGTVFIDITGGPGPQNNHIMARSDTGLTEEGREQIRSFSQLSQLKLEFADGVAFQPQARASEAASQHADFSTAQRLGVDVSPNRPVADVRSVYLESAFLDDPAQEDFYSFVGRAGEAVTLNINNRLDFAISLYGPGQQELLRFDQTNYAADALYEFFNAAPVPPLPGTKTQPGFGAVNFPLNDDGTFFIKVFSNSTGFGFYDLLVALNPSPHVVELDSGTLTVFGDSSDNTIKITEDNGDLVVAVDAVEYRVLLSDVTKIIFDISGGNDTVDVQQEVKDSIPIEYAGDPRVLGVTLERSSTGKD